MWTLVRINLNKFIEDCRTNLCIVLYSRSLYVYPHTYITLLQNLYAKSSSIMHSAYIILLHVMLLSDVPKKNRYSGNAKHDFQINEKVELTRLTPNKCKIEFWLACLIGYASKTFRKIRENFFNYSWILYNTTYPILFFRLSYGL